MTEENTKLHPNGRWKQCRACLRKSRQRYQIRHSTDLTAYQKSYRQENKAAISEYKRKSYQKIRQAITELKEGKPCHDCGNIYPSVCMDFDHLPGTEKLFNVGLAKNLKQLEAEIAKCQLVCANCHRIRTFLKRLRCEKVLAV